ncbi:MAG: two-component system, OmpR family, sensor histidine kinase MtrB, partial [Actinomycetota bacterium]|nr:two-component system, OmpR family, sensor histidine kinase MtrB [Actinomycetota bacterium]
AVASLSPSRDGENGGYEVVGYQLISGTTFRTEPALRPSLQVSSVPQALIDSVTSGGDTRAYYTYTTLVYSGGTSVPGLAIGRSLPVLGNQYQLYYLFSLQGEQQTLALVSRTLLLSGLALVALLAGIAWLVTHQVVTPVRMAARIAERLADGRLQERMKPKGEDDLARLAASFNKMAESLQRQIRRLEELSRIQRRFVSDVSHELRTPLTTVRMAADVLHEARADFDPASARSAELLQTQLDRFESLLADLLEISRHDAGAASLEADAIDVRDLVRRVVEAMEPLALRRGSTVVLHLPDDLCVCEADSRRVERILRNLLVNAAEHGEGGPIEVHVVADDDVVAIAIRDHGIGLRPGEAALVFNRFWRADPARARTTGGTGLGLSIASEDARLHGGRLQAWGERGKGSQFVLTLPRRAGSIVTRSTIPLEPADAASDEPIAASATVPAPPRPAPSDLGKIGTLRGGRD